MATSYGGYNSESSSSLSTPPTDEEMAPPIKGTEEKLMVALRVRPLGDEEGDRILHCVDDRTVLLDESEQTDKNDILRQKRGGERKYVYDVAFGEDSTQEQVYNATTRHLVRDVVLGYNVTVFAYGATGSGKTHTMCGNSTEPGLMVRALNDLFHSIDKSGHKCTVSLSYLEIYNENIRDLLNPSSGFLDLREDTNRARNITVAGLTEVTANSTQEVMNLLQKGNKERIVEPTAANMTSSRSHALLSVTVKASTDLQGNTFRTRMRMGKLYMLDLAGSERASQTKNRGKRLLEGAHINRSLLALGNVINSLSGGGSRYVNYRDSKLTRLLREALGGNCRTVMIAHASPASLHREETRNTLVYAARASSISHKVERNVLDVSFHVSQYRNIIADLRSEITRLRSKMAEERPDSADRRIPMTATTERLQVKQLREQIVSNFREQMKLRRRLMDIDGHLLSLGVEAERQHQIISQWESRNNKLYHRSKDSRPGTTTTTESADQWSDSGELNMHQAWSELSYIEREQERYVNLRSATLKDLDECRQRSVALENVPMHMHQAWSELSYIEREQERYVNLRSATLKDLDECRQRSVALENELPSRLDSETEREMLSLLCRVHELEADKMALQGERLVESHELRRRGELLQRFHRQQRITDDIITRQRQLMEEGHVSLPPDLQELYNLYQQEIHATTYSTVDTAGLPYSAYDRLPPINNNKENDTLFDKTSRVATAADNFGRNVENDLTVRTPTSSSTGSSEWESGLPPLRTQLSNKLRQHGQSSTPPASVLFPPLINNHKT